MKTKQITFALLAMILSCNEKTYHEVADCPSWISKENIGYNIGEETGQSESFAGSSFSLSFNPLLLPFKIKFNLEKGFYVEHSGNAEIATLIGTFGIEYSYASEGTINGKKITKNDCIVSIVNKTKGTKDLFKITGYSHLKVTLSGTTTIDAHNGHVQIDATNSVINEINFYDESKVVIYNATNKALQFYIEHRSSNNYDNNIYLNSCQLSSKAYKSLSLVELDTSVDKSSIYIWVDDNDPKNDSKKRIGKRVSYGDICQIYTNNNSLELKKITWSDISPYKVIENKISADTSIQEDFFKL
jgi:hypothetical protein